MDGKYDVEVNLVIHTNHEINTSILIFTPKRLPCAVILSI